MLVLHHVGELLSTRITAKWEPSGRTEKGENFLLWELEIWTGFQEERRQGHRKDKSLLFTLSPTVPRAMEMKWEDSRDLFHQYANHVMKHKWLSKKESVTQARYLTRLVQTRGAGWNQCKEVLLEFCRPPILKLGPGKRRELHFMEWALYSKNCSPVFLTTSTVL